MKKNKEVALSKAGIAFYVLAVIFLCIAAFSIFTAYASVGNYSTQYALTFNDKLNVYITQSAGYFAYAFLAYGVGMILNKLSNLTSALELCMVDASEKEDETSDDDLVAELKAAIKEEKEAETMK